MADKSHPPILVVDDNPDNAHIIRDYLEARGYPIRSRTTAMTR